jgi:hypothetical protein
MRITVPLTVYMLVCAPVAMAQVGGGSAGGGGARGGGASPGVTAAPSPAAPSTAPGAPAPGVANTPVDPGRNNVDANPPSQALQRTNPSATAPTTTPQPQQAQPGGTSSAPGRGAAGRPGAAQSANSDGYAECMAMWNPTDVKMSKKEWSATCDGARLPPKESAKQ